ncbi:helix-turn-helix transcriptional regulator [Methylobacterium sp. SI9]|uniref:helix-turn-helix domain-containing protein n=1 Tax=Methylobacterium guangdongense TaxID=3138811 RepID=UPI00313C13ED
MAANSKQILSRLKDDIDKARHRVAMAEDVKAEGAAARDWRISMGLSRPKLAELTGYSERTIAAYEAGRFDADKLVTPRALHTYRLACAAVALGVEFDWRSASLRLGPAVVTVPTTGEAGAMPAVDTPEG